MRFEAMFYVKRRQKGNVYRGFGGVCGAVQQKHAARFCGLGGFDCGRVFVVGRNMGAEVCAFEVERDVRRACVAM